MENNPGMEAVSVERGFDFSRRNCLPAGNKEMRSPPLPEQLFPVRSRERHKFSVGRPWRYSRAGRNLREFRHEPGGRRLGSPAPPEHVGGSFADFLRTATDTDSPCAMFGHGPRATDATESSPQEIFSFSRGPGKPDFP